MCFTSTSQHLWAGPTVGRGKQGRFGTTVTISRRRSHSLGPARCPRSRLEQLSTTVASILHLGPHPPESQTHYAQAHCMCAALLHPLDGAEERRSYSTGLSPCDVIGLARRTGGRPRQNATIQPVSQGRPVPSIPISEVQNHTTARVHEKRSHHL